MEQGNSYKACLRCGKLMPTEAHFCNSCGADLKAAPVPGTQGAVDPGEFKGMAEAGVSYVPQVTPPVATAPSPGAVTAPLPPPPGAPPAFQQQYPVQSYLRPGYPYPSLYQAVKTDELAVISISCAVASFVILPLLPAIAAIVLGFVSRDRISKSEGNLKGNGIAIAGIIVGAINMLLWVVLITLIVVYAPA